MIEKYFSGNRENEVELSVEIKRCLKDFVLKKSEHIFYVVEFHDFELTPKKVFEFADFKKYCDFFENRYTPRPYLIIEKNDEFFVELAGNEILASFDLIDNDIKIDIFRVLRIKHIA
jgi:hypothetical protein